MGKTHIQLATQPSKQASNCVVAIDVTRDVGPLGKKKKKKKKKEKKERRRRRRRKKEGRKERKKERKKKKSGTIVSFVAADPPPPPAPRFSPPFNRFLRFCPTNNFGRAKKKKKGAVGQRSRQEEPE